jgi:hypothetical protein
VALDVVYDPVLSRMRLHLSGGLSSHHALFARSIDGGVTFTTVRGASAVPVTGVGLDAFADDYEFPAGVSITYRATKYDVGGSPVSGISATPITQDLSKVWLKVPAAPFLNQTVTVAGLGSDIGRRSRSALLDIVGRHLPVGVGDVASSQAFTLLLLTETPDQRRDLDYLFASGEVVFLHLPSTVDDFPGGYFLVPPGESVTHGSTLRLSPRHLWTVPLVEAAEPGPDVVGSAYTWTSVLADYPTWADVIAANATWADLLARTGSPSDVIVP